jgi:hypothetical protein
MAPFFEVFFQTYGTKNQKKGLQLIKSFSAVISTWYSGNLSAILAVSFAAIFFLSRAFATQATRR